MAFSEGKARRGRSTAPSVPPAAEVVLREAHQAVYHVPLPELSSLAATNARFFGLYAGISGPVYDPTSESSHGFDRCGLERLRAAG